jgi:GSH-dependent disulfide-bond oxidoreductase
MIDLYAAGTSNGMRARIALEECELAYNYHPVDLVKGEHKTPQFLAMNPFGLIPVLKDSEGPGGKPVVLSQSSAILLYCAEKSGRHLPKDRAARPAMLQALMQASTDVTPMFGAVNTAMRMKEAHAPTVDAFKGRLKAMFQTWDGILARQAYAAGAELTIADLSLYAGYWRTKGALPELLAGMPALERWANTMAARAAIQRATKV